MVILTATQIASALGMDAMALRAWLRRYQEKGGDLKLHLDQVGRQWTFTPADAAMFAIVRKLIDANVVADVAIPQTQAVLRAAKLQTADDFDVILKKVKGHALAFTGTKARLVKSVPIDAELIVVVGLEQAISAMFKKLRRA